MSICYYSSNTYYCSTLTYLTSITLVLATDNVTYFIHLKRIMWMYIHHLFTCILIIMNYKHLPVFSLKLNYLSKFWMLVKIKFTLHSSYNKIIIKIKYINNIVYVSLKYLHIFPKYHQKWHHQTRLILPQYVHHATMISTWYSCHQH